MNRLPPVSSLMSPPEHKPADSFNTSNTPINSNQSSFNSNPQPLPSFADSFGQISGATMANQKISPSKIPLSPPVSPWVGNNKSQGQEADTPPVSPWANHQAEGHDVDIGSPTPKNVHATDPVLYPPSEAGTDHTVDPLFPSEQSQVSAEDEVITSHINRHMDQFEDEQDKPTFQEYALALKCVPVVCREYNKNPRAWRLREDEILEQQFAAVRRRKMAMQTTQYKALAPATRNNDVSSKITKPTRAPRAVPRTPAQRTPRQPASRPSRTTPKTTVFNDFDSPFYTPSKPRAIAERTEDNNYEAIEDFCPPVATLANTKGLKAEWKGAGLPLDDDPDRMLLLPAEVQMASALRLTCAQYLTTKRRIFKAKVELLRQGVEAFKKTHAQKAGHIDVNKASRLWTAYDRVGWFDTKHFLRYL